MFSAIVRGGLAAALLATPVFSPALAATLQVGVGKQYTDLQRAANAANPGDTIEIFAGTYTKGAAFFDNDLIIRRAPGQPVNSVRLRGPVNGKGVFQIKGDNNIIEGLRFENAAVPDGNGAGIRLDGANLIVRDCYFSGNEMGILATPVTGRVGGLTVERSTFTYTRSKVAGRIGHAIYASTVSFLTVRDSKFYRTTDGHYIKSRAPANSIIGNLIDDSNGKASYLIEIAEGGGATITGNTLTKGPTPANCCIAISYGSEMKKGGSYVNAPGPVLIAENRFTNKAAYAVNFVNNVSVPANPVSLRDNLLVVQAGSVVPLRGPGTVSNGGADLAMESEPAADLFAVDGRDDYSVEDRPEQELIDSLAGDPPAHEEEDGAAGI